MKDLDLAIKAYQTEYGTEPSLKEFWKDERTPILAEGEILKVLMSQNERLNPRKIAFFEPPTDRGSEKRPGTMKLENGDLRIVDYNGNPFSILIDLDDDRRIPNPDPGAKEDEKLTGKVLIYTAGKDGNPSTWDDNLKSWE